MRAHSFASFGSALVSSFAVPPSLRTLAFLALAATACGSQAGPAGPAGTEGPAGATGAAGNAGSPGSAGDTGATGPIGPTGDAGATGATGATGGVQYVRTIVVSPVPGDAVASGTNLRQALTSIADASSTNPYLVWIEPGIFDLGTTALVLQDDVDVQGSGEDATTIEGTLTTFNGYVLSLANAELRSLRLEIESGTGASYTSGVYCDTKSPTLRNVTVDVPAAAGEVSAIFLPQCTSLLDTVTVTGTAPAGQLGLWGVEALAGTLVATDLTVQITCDGTSECIGFASSNGALSTVRDSTVALTGTSTMEAVWGADGQVTLDDVVASTTGGGVNLSDAVLCGPTSATQVLTVRNSTLSGTDSIAAGVESDGVSSTVDVAASQLSGPVLDFSEGETTSSFTCVGDYDASFAPLGATCQPVVAGSVRGDVSARRREISRDLEAHVVRQRRHVTR